MSFSGAIDLVEAGKQGHANDAILTATSGEGEYVCREARGSLLKCRLVACSANCLIEIDRAAIAVLLNGEWRRASTDSFPSLRTEPAAWRNVSQPRGIQWLLS